MISGIKQKRFRDEYFISFVLFPSASEPRILIYGNWSVNTKFSVGIPPTITCQRILPFRKGPLRLNACRRYIPRYIHVLIVSRL